VAFATPKVTPRARLDILESALRDDMIDHINVKQSMWKAGRNEYFEGMTLTQAKALMGTRLDGKLPPAIKLTYDKLKVHSSFDAREERPDCPSVSLVRDQSACGSCWAFGSTEAFNDRLCIAKNNTVILSPADVLSCCSLFTCGDGCDGGYPSGAWSYFKSTGLVPESCFEYPFAACAHHVVSPDYPPCPSAEYSTPKCNKTCADGTTFSNDKIKASSHYSISSESDIMQEISTKGPVTAAFTVYSDFLAYQSGVYKHTSGSELGGHAIEIVGYGEDNGVKYWTVKNSWNKSWGNEGYFNIVRGTNECGIEGSVVAGDA
jgi:cathepsin B